MRLLTKLLSDGIEVKRLSDLMSKFGLEMAEDCLIFTGIALRDVLVNCEEGKHVVDRLRFIY